MLLQPRYIRSADVIARGLSGYNTNWYLNDVVPFIEQEIRAKEFATPSLIAIWLGANDAALWNGSNSETHVPIKQYKENLVKIASSLWLTAPTANLLLITPPHVDDAVRLEFAVDRNDTKRGLLDRTNVMSKEYARACVEAAGVLGVPVLDLNSYFNAIPESERNALLLDGLHFNLSGNQLVYEQLQNKLATEFPSLNEALENWQFPAASKWVAEDPWTAGSKTEDSR